MDNNLNTILKKYNNHIFLALLIIIVSIITYYRVLIQIDIGPLSDSCDFLSNALVFTGQDMSYFDSTRPPFFSFLISLIFMTGFISTNVIFVLDGLLFIFGVIGMFFLLKLQFNNIQSFLGSLLYATFPIVLAVMSTGFSDLASVSIAIWMFYFLILAVKKDSKYLIIVFPLAMLAFLTRYNNILLIFPIFLYILINRGKIKGLKNMIIGIFSSILLLIPVFMFFNQKFGDAIYPFTAPFKMTSSTVISSGNAAYDANLLFFIEKLPSFIGFEGTFALLIILFGFFIYSILRFKNNSDNPKNKNLIDKLKVTEQGIKLKLILFGVLVFLFIVSFNNILVYYSEVLFFVITLLLYDITKNLNIKSLDIHLLFLSWFMAFFIFHSIFTIKDNRYFVIMAPSITYFLILSLNKLSNKLNLKIKDHNFTFLLITLTLTILVFFSTSLTLMDIGPANNNTRITNEIVYSANAWFINYDPDYKNKIIYSDLWPYFSWDLKMDIKPMPVFKDGQKYYGGVKDFNITTEDSISYNNELVRNNADYFFCFREGVNLTSYKPIKQFNYLIIYQKI